MQRDEVCCVTYEIFVGESDLQQDFVQGQTSGETMSLTDISFDADRHKRWLI